MELPLHIPVYNCHKFGKSLKDWVNKTLVLPSFFFWFNAFWLCTFYRTICPSAVLREGAICQMQSCKSSAKYLCSAGGLLKKEMPDFVLHFADE